MLQLSSTWLDFVTSYYKMSHVIGSRQREAERGGVVGR